MIISASRRTDIPTYYSEWFFNRLKEGYVLVRNPINVHQISRISLRPDVVDGIVFWTKNPIPMLSNLKRLHDYTYYFQFTVTAYGKDMERNVPSKNDIIIPAFQRLSDLIGPDRIIWRYDPIFITGTYTVEYHIRFFSRLAKRLSGYTRKCTISFLDLYQKIRNNVRRLAISPATPEQQDFLAGHLAEIARCHGLKIDMCAEEKDFQQYGIQRARCIDDRLFAKFLNSPLTLKKDRYQRQACGCMESIDIGAYNTCLNGCCYCYANFSEKTAKRNQNDHDPEAPLLFGVPDTRDQITDRKEHSSRVRQLELWP